jgi:hypothetical protein
LHFGHDVIPESGVRVTLDRRRVRAPAGGQGGRAEAGHAVGRRRGLTPLPEHNRLDAMDALPDDALARDNRVANHDGGRGSHSLMRPAVVYPVADGMRAVPLLARNPGTRSSISDS